MKKVVTFIIYSSIFIINNAYVKFNFFSTQEVINFLEKHLPDDPLIVEAGASYGRDTVYMKKKWPRAIVHAFEPVPDLYNRLVVNTKNFSGIYCYKLALSNKTGEVPFFLSAFNNKPEIVSESSSLLRPKEHLKYAAHVIFPRKIMVSAIKLDRWAEDNNIKQIDLLWLDLQGFELDVLKASPRILKNIKVIFTEVEFVEAYEGQYLFGDVDQWMVTNGFVRVAQDFDIPAKLWCGNALYMRKDVRKLRS